MFSIIIPPFSAHFEKETTVTFYYSDNPADEKSDMTILQQFAYREALLRDF